MRGHHAQGLSLNWSTEISKKKSEILNLKLKQLGSTKITHCQIDELCVNLISLKMFLPSCIGHTKSPVLHKNFFLLTLRLLVQFRVLYAGLLWAINIFSWCSWNISEATFLRCCRIFSEAILLKVLQDLGGVSSNHVVNLWT